MSLILIKYDVAETTSLTCLNVIKTKFSNKKKPYFLKNIKYMCLYACCVYCVYVYMIYIYMYVSVLHNKPTA